MIYSKLSVLILCGFLLSACGFLRGKSSAPKGYSKNAQVMVRDFQKGSDYLDKEDYAGAAKHFEEFRRKYPSSNLDLVSLFNLAAAYEGQNLCGKAANRYRRLVKTARKVNPRLAAQAYMRLSHAYECVGRDDKVVSSLLDIQPWKQFLDSSVSLVEVPARLAAAYARLGNRDMAQKFFTQAQLGLRQMKATNKNWDRENSVIAKTLYFLGYSRLGKYQRQDLDKLISNLKYTQSYLLQAVELDSKEWSGKAEQHILDHYSKVWVFLNAPLSNPEDEESRRVEFLQRREQAQSALLTLSDLKAERFPDTKEPRIIRQLFMTLDKHEQRLQNYIAQTSQEIGNPLTPSAREREGLKRRGKVINRKKTILEKKPRTP